MALMTDEASKNFHIYTAPKAQGCLANQEISSCFIFFNGSKLKSVQGFSGSALGLFLYLEYVDGKGKAPD